MRHGVGVALAAFKNCCNMKMTGRKARKLVRRGGRGAGLLRDADVHAGLVAALRDRGQAATPALKYVMDRIDKDRAMGEERLWGAFGSGLCQTLAKGR